MDKKKIGAGFAGALQKAADATKAAKLAVQDMAADAKQSREKKKADAQKVLGTFASNTFDAVITDPPYASGGRTQAEKQIHRPEVFQHGRERTAPFRRGRQGPALLDPLGGRVAV